METKIPLFSSLNGYHPIKVNIKIAVLRWEKVSTIECNNKKKDQSYIKTETIYFFDFSTFSQTPHISISVAFSLVTIDLTLFPGITSLYKMNERVKFPFFFVWNIFQHFLAVFARVFQEERTNSNRMLSTMHVGSGHQSPSICN